MRQPLSLLTVLIAVPSLATLFTCLQPPLFAAGNEFAFIQCGTIRSLASFESCQAALQSIQESTNPVVATTPVVPLVTVELAADPPYSSVSTAAFLASRLVHANAYGLGINFALKATDAKLNLELAGLFFSNLGATLDTAPSATAQFPVFLHGTIWGVPACSSPAGFLGSGGLSTSTTSSSLPPAVSDAVGVCLFFGPDAPAGVGYL